MVAARGRNNPNIPDNTYLTVSLQPRELPSRSDRNTLPSCCPRSLPLPRPCLPRPISVPACSPENHVVVPRGYIPGGGCFQALRSASAAHVGASASFGLYIARVTLYHSSAGLLSFRVMVYARARMQVRRSHFLGRVGG